MRQTLRWEMRRAAVSSWLKRSSDRPSASSPDRSTLTAIFSPVRVSRALKTWPIPPWPRSSMIWYRPANRAPGESSWMGRSSVWVSVTPVSGVPVREVAQVLQNRESRVFSVEHLGQVTVIGRFPWFGENIRTLRGRQFRHPLGPLKAEAHPQPARDRRNEQPGHSEKVVGDVPDALVELPVLGKDHVLGHLQVIEVAKGKIGRGGRRVEDVVDVDVEGQRCLP